jgi:hypothetical protein
MASKEISLSKQEIVLPKKMYSSVEVSADTYYAAPFEGARFKRMQERNFASLKYYTFENAFPLTSIGFGAGTMAAASISSDFLGIGMLAGTALGVISGFFISRKSYFKNKKRYAYASNIIQANFSNWILNRYSVSMDNEELIKVANHISTWSYYAKNKESHIPDLLFQGTDNKAYLLKSDPEEGWYVIQYVDTKNEEKKIRVLNVDKLTELETKQTLNKKQQTIFDSITEKVAKLKNIRMTAEKMFTVQRINADLQEVLKLNDYGTSLASQSYDSSKITTILAYLEKELDTIFDDEIKDIEHQLAARMKMLNDRSPEDNSELRISSK